MLRTAFRTSSRTHSIRVAGSGRAFHAVTAEFVELDPDGKAVTTRESIRIGDPGEAYILIPPEIGHAFQAASPTIHVSESAISNSQAKCTLCFFHDTRHFAHGTTDTRYMLSTVLLMGLSEGMQFPRLVIPQNLPQHAASAKSPATLWLYGKMHTIALNGTFDGRFAI